MEFITLISSEANEISEKESKKTIACEHITKALEQLGFGEYVSEILEVASEHKEQLKVRLLFITDGYSLGQTFPCPDLKQSPISESCKAQGLTRFACRAERRRRIN